MKVRVSILLGCALVGFNPLLFSAQSASNQTHNADATTTTAGKKAEPRPAQLSPGLDDIVKLSKAGISDSVIATYVQTSGQMYHVTPNDLIQLSEAGVSPDVTTLLMQQGDALRQNAIQSQQQSQAAAQEAAQQPLPQPAQPAQTYAVAPTYVTPPAVSTVTYIGRPTFFGRPVNSHYTYTGYYYPRTYYGRSYCYTPRVSFGYRHYYGGFHGRFRHCR